MIYVYKTSVRAKKDIQKLKPHLNVLLKHGNWNFDLEDCDKILRVDNDIEVSGLLVELLSINGFKCEELF